MTTRNVTLELTPEQEETIKALFGHSGWEYKEIETKKGMYTQQMTHMYQQLGLDIVLCLFVYI